MSNNLSSNITDKVARIFLKSFENKRVLTKTIDTQLFSGDFTPQFGDTIRIKRPVDYRAIRTTDGDLSAQSVSPIIVGNAQAEVQNYITVWTDWTNREEALELDQLTQILEPAATRAVTELETSLFSYMRVNGNLGRGTPGTAVTAWEHVATCGAMMESIGVPRDSPWYYVMNPFTQVKLSSAQTALLQNNLVDEAWKRAVISENFGGMKVMASNTIGGFTNGTCADRAGTLASTPTATYVTYKDTMTQTLAVAGFTAGGTIAAGEIVEITGRYYLNQATRQPLVDQTGAQVKFRGVVTEGVTLNSSGAGSITIAGAGIYEATGAYNTVPAALESGDVITILGTSAATVSPNLFYHKQAFSMATVRLPKLAGWDNTVATTKDGVSIRVVRYSDGTANTQKIRFDLLPAFGVMNPFFAGISYGYA